MLAAVAGALGKFLLIGPFLITVFTAWVVYIAPAVLTMLMVHFVKKYFLGQEATAK